MKVFIIIGFFAIVAVIFICMAITSRLREKATRQAMKEAKSCKEEVTLLRN